MPLFSTRYYGHRSTSRRSRMSLRRGARRRARRVRRTTLCYKVVDKRCNNIGRDVVCQWPACVCASVARHKCSRVYDNKHQYGYSDCKNYVFHTYDLLNMTRGRMRMMPHVARSYYKAHTDILAYIVEFVNGLGIFCAFLSNSIKKRLLSWRRFCIFSSVSITWRTGGHFGYVKNWTDVHLYITNNDKTQMCIPPEGPRHHVLLACIRQHVSEQELG